MSLLTDASLIVTPNAYKESKLYSVIPNTVLGDMNIVRATTATRVNSAGLIELVPRNLLTYSNTFTNGDWSTSQATLTSGQSGYDGTSNAYKLQATGTNCYLYQGSFNFSRNQSVYAKAGNYTQISFIVGGYNNGVQFNLTTGTIANNTNSSYYTPSIESVGNGWYRCSVAVSSAAPTYPFLFAPNFVAGGYSASGDFIYIQNAQTEFSATATEYFPTTTRLNIPRLDYSNGICPSILVEPQSTNLLLRSEEFENFAWNKGTGGSISANSVISPSGISNADAYTWAGSTIAFAYLSQVASSLSQNSHTFSIWLKRPFGSGSRTISLCISDVFVSTASSSIFTVTETWQRFQFTRASASATGQVGVGFIFGASGTSIAAGDILNVWGAQLELGSSPTSYIPTTASTVTRNADVISKTGISSLIGPTEGTIYAEINNTLMTYSATGYVMRIFADANNEVWIRKESGSNKYTAKWRANSVDVYTQSNISVLNGNNKIAIAYKTGNSAVYLNGTQIGTSASTGAFAVAPSQIGIGSSSTADFFNDRIELATVFPTRLTNAQLATLTTL